MKDAGVVILAAGRSERMQEFKALLRFDAENRFLGKMLSTYAGWGCDEIVVVTNRDALQQIEQSEPLPDTVTVVVNDRLELERFHSVKLGLGAMDRSGFCFIQDVDNPFIDADILDLLYEKRNDRTYVSPVYQGKGGHPVLLNRQTIKHILTWPREDATLKEVLGQRECTRIEMPDERVLININSPEDYKKYVHGTDLP